MASPTCTVQDGSSSPISITGSTYGAVVTPGNTVTIALIDSTNVKRWYPRVVAYSGGDPALVPATVNAATATFAAPPNAAWLLINSAIDTGAGPIQASEFGIFVGAPPPTFVGASATDVASMQASLKAANSVIATLEIQSVASTIAGALMRDAAPIKRPGSITRAWAQMGRTTFAAGESVSLYLRKNGSGILSAPKTIDSSVAARGVVDLTSMLASAVSYINGDDLSVDAVYTPGNAPNFPSFAVMVSGT